MAIDGCEAGESRLTKRDHSYSLKEAAVDEEFSFQISPELTWNRNALCNDCDNDHQHAD